MLQPNRHGGENYRYNFQGQETDDEVKGKGNSVNYKYRMHDPRLGRFFAVDPLSADYPHNSPYAFSENVVINAVELEGLEKEFVYDYSLTGPGTINASKEETKAYQETAASYSLLSLIKKIAWDPVYDQAVADGQAQIDAYNEDGINGAIYTGIAQAHRDEGSDYAHSQGAASKQRTSSTKIKTISNAKLEKLANQKTAEKMLGSPSKRKMPKKVTTVYDENTGKTYVGTNGTRSLESIDKKVQSKLPSNSTELWPCQQCSEVDGLNNAAKDGATIGDNLKIFTNKTDKKTNSFQSVETCSNCKTTTNTVIVVSDP